MNDEQEPLPKPPRRRRRVVVVVLAIVVAAALLLPVVAWRWLTSSAGGEYLREKILADAKSEIAGRLEIDRVTVSGFLRLELEGVRLYAPGDAKPAVTIDRAIADVRVSALVAKRLELGELTVGHPVVDVVTEGDSTNLARALAKSPAAKAKARAKAAEQETKPSRFSIAANDVRVTDGVYLREGDEPLELAGLDLSGSVSGRANDLTISATSSAQLVRPLDRDVKLHLDARMVGDRLSLSSLVLDTGRSTLRLHGRLSTALTDLNVTVDELHLAPSDVRAFAPKVALEGAITAKASAVLDAGSAELVVDARPPVGKVTVLVTAKVAPGLSFASIASYSVLVQTHGFDPQRVVAAWPSAELNAKLDVHGTGLPGKGSADVNLDASGSRYEGLLVDEAKLSAHVVGETAKVSSLSLATAGAKVEASGELSTTRANVELAASVPDLSRLRAKLPGEVARKLPPMAGAAEITGHVVGPYASPTGELSMKVPRLAYAGTRVTGARARVRLDGFSPLTATLSDAHVGSFVAGGYHGRGLDLAATIDGREVSVKATGELAREVANGRPTFRPVRVDVEGRRLESAVAGAEQWQIDRLALSALGLTVASEQPAKVTVGPNEKAINQLVLGGKIGHVALSGGLGAEGALRGSLTVDSLRLDRLPPALVQLAKPLAGSLSGSASVGGTTSEPSGRAHFELSNGGYGALGPLSAALDGSLAGGRVEGTAQVSIRQHGQVVVEARLPAGKPGPSMAERVANQPISATVTVDGLDVSLLSLVEPRLPQVSGRVAGQVTLTGSWAAPKLDGTLQVADATGLGVDRLDATSTVSWSEGKARLGIDLERSPTLTAHAEVALPLAAKDVLGRERPNLRAVPMEATVSIANADLAWLASLDFVPLGTRGTLTGQLHATGTLREPRLDGELDGHRLALGRWSPLDAQLQLAADGALSAHLKTQLFRQELVDADVTVKVPPAKAGALTGEDWLKVPLDVELQLLPTPLARLVATPTEPGESSAVEGEVNGRVSLTGTLDAPVANARLAVEDLRRGDRRLGALHFTAASRGTRTTLDGGLDSTTSGSMSLHGALGGTFSASALAALGRARLAKEQPGTTPTLGHALSASVADVLARQVDATFDARALDLSLLDGLSESLRDVSGHLDAHLEKHGPLSSPLVEGQVALGNGRATIASVGAFDEVRLDLAVHWPEVILSDFSGKSGDGGFSMHGRLGPVARGYLGEFHARLDALPIVRHYETRGYLTLKVDAPRITWSGDLLDVPKLELSKGVLRIPEASHKNIEPLEPNPDFVIAGTKTAGAAKPWRPTWKARVGIVVPDDFRVDAPLGNTVVFGAKLTARVDEALAKDGGAPFDLAGRMGLVRGTMHLPPLPPKFLLQPTSNITFVSRRYTDPTLDVTAVYEKSDVTITATITGTLENPVKAFTSKPPMDESEILYFLATGQLQQHVQSAPFALSRQDVTDTLTGFASGVLRDALNKFLGGAVDIDELSVNTEGGVKLGTYLWNGKLYIGYQTHPDANIVNGENNWDVDGEYRFNATTFGRLKVGDQNRDQLEILYQNNIPSEAQKKAGEAPP